MPIEDMHKMSLGSVTAYALAVRYGFQGTEEEWAERLADCASQADLDELREEISYVALAISSFTVTPSAAEIGSTVDAVTLAYNLNKKPDVLKLNEVAQPLNKQGSWELTGLGLSADNTWTLKAEDHGSPTHAASKPSKNATLHFYNRIYYGAAEEPVAVDSAFLLGLSDSVLSGTKGRTISSVTAGNGQYIWYALPKRLGEVSFVVGGFAGGFEPKQEITHTNSSGHTEAYYVYRSTNAGLGKPTIVIS